MRRYRILACLGALAALAAPAAARADFGLQTINTSGTVEVPAIPAQKAGWFGSCDLGSPSTSNGGIGTAPALRAHCIDVGGGSYMYFEPGNQPSWRLDPSTQAGAHPDVTTMFSFEHDDFFTEFPPGSGNLVRNVQENVKDIVVRLPPGMVGAPTTVPQCSARDVQFVPPRCGPETQVGISTISLFMGQNTYPVYNAEARDTVTAELSIGNVASLFNVPIAARGRTNGDYGIDTLALLIPSYQPLSGQAFTVWGVPWAEQHDRYRIAEGGFGPNSQEIPFEGLPDHLQAPYDPAEPSWQDDQGEPLPIRPFFTNPTRCTGSPISVGLDLASWQDQDDGKSYELSEDVMEGCEQLEFEPSIELRPTLAVADSPSGLDVTLRTPQNNEPPAEALGNPNLPFDPADDTGAPAYWKTPAGLATAHLKDTTVRLPEGTSFNPAAANGLRGCTTAQVGMTSAGPPVTFDKDPHQCPDTAKLGALEIVSPLLPDPLEGSVYAAPQHDNPFPGSLTAIYLVAQDDERGLSVKLAGRVDLDPVTGQIATTLIDNPQLPFESFELHFKSGSRAPLNTPATCGQFANAIDLTPWSFPHSGPIATIQDSFPISATPNGQPCVTEPEDRLFAPGFDAGSTNPQAGASTAFILNVTRRDGDQELSAITLDMAPGLTARLAGTPYCPDATLSAIETGRTGLAESQSSLCPAAAEIGSVHTLAGAGSQPLPTSGRLYLAGPFQGAPLSVAAIVPAIAGGIPGQPAFDLGNVVVRSAVHVDPKTAQVRVQSTRLPYILGGVPLRVRRASVEITKPGFMLNPTNCEAMGVGASLGGAADPFDPADDISVAVSNRFQVDGCANLGFKPKLSLRLKGGTRRGDYQRLRATLRARPGDANIARAAVRMPRAAFLAQDHIATVCTRVQFAAEACPTGSVYGRATAISPLLDQPLRGAVYLRSSDNPLPDLVADLRGPAHQPIRIELVGRTDSVKRALRNTFDLVPDAPVSEFTMELFGGRRSLIVLSRSICAGANRATVNLRAQNGRRLRSRPAVRNPACKGQRKAKKGGGGGHKRSKAKRGRG